MPWLILSSALAFGTAVVDVHIEAEPDRVWAVLTDFEHYGGWNPWLTEAKGAAEVGAAVDATVVLNGRTRQASHRVTEVQAPHRFCWQDAGWFTLLAQGWRCRTMTANPGGGTDFRVELGIEGSFSGMEEKRYGQTLREGLKAETEALKAEAERGP